VIPLLNAADVKRAEENAISQGTSEQELMLTAGNKTAALIDSQYLAPGHAVVLCGPGNNGGDGIVVASALCESGWTAAIWTWNRSTNAQVPVNTDEHQELAWISTEAELKSALLEADVVIDAVFGTGSRPDLPEGVSGAFDLIRRVIDSRHIDIWAVDLPSGVDSDTGEAAQSALEADATAMIGLPKEGAFIQPASRFTGEIHLVDIGLSPPDSAEDEHVGLIDEESVRRVIPRRRAGAHKRSTGTVMVIGGAPNYYGAPRLTGEAALRAGAGLVSVATTTSIISSIATAVPEFTFIPLPVSEHHSGATRMASIVHENISKYDTIVVGPGLGTDAPVPEFLSRVFGLEQSGRSSIGFGTSDVSDKIEPFSGRAVVDADALNMLARQDEWWTKLKDAELVLTPHPGELARLLDTDRETVENSPWEHAQRAAQSFGQVVVLKYAHMIVATPEGQIFVAPQAPAGVATAGTGDVLAGIIGAMLAGGNEPVSAAIAGVGLAIEAAMLASEEHGSIGFTASDIIFRIPGARERVVRSVSRLP
jgi:ADP-dependent NAD(P)H-hydrate dehydratase / NAD(P)H-hydrate epimerase